MQPQPFSRPPPPEPTGSWLSRAARALLVEHRLPYSVGLRLDRMLKQAGVPYKTISVGGLELRVRRDTADTLLAHNVILDGDYNPPGYEIHDTDTVIDIGANLGCFTVLAASKARKGRVFSFEPVTENVQLLRENIALNRFDNVVVEQCAVVDTPQKVRIYLDDAQAGCHSVLEAYAPDTAHYETAPGITLGDIFERHQIERCDFLKLDCEGAEYQILYTLDEKYFERITRIALEYHSDVPETKLEQADGLITLLEKMGFQIDQFLDTLGCTTGYITAHRVAT